MTDLEYWKECISESADSCGLKLTSEQLEMLANDISNAHDTYSQAFYSPGWDDRFKELESNYKKENIKLKEENNEYKRNAEIAVKRLLKLDEHDQINIDQYGGVEVQGTFNYL